MPKPFGAVAKPDPLTITKGVAMNFFVTHSKTILALIMVFVASTVSATECVPSHWGANDQIGAANRVTPERTMAAAKLIKKA